MIQNIQFYEIIDIISKNKFFPIVSKEYYSSFKNNTKKLKFDTSKNFNLLSSIYSNHINSNNLTFSEKELLSLFFFVNTDIYNLKKIFILSSLNKNCFYTPSYDKTGSIVLNKNSNYNMPYSVYSPFSKISNPLNKTILNVFDSIKDHIVHKYITGTSITYKNNSQPIHTYIYNNNPECLSNGFFTQLDKETQTPDKLSIPKKITNNLELKVFEIVISKMKITKNVLDIIKKIDTSRYSNIRNTGEFRYTNHIAILNILLKKKPELKNKKYFIDYLLSINLSAEILDSNVPIFLCEEYLKIFTNKNHSSFLYDLIYLELFRNIQPTEFTQDFIDRLKDSKVVEKTLDATTNFKLKNREYSMVQHTPFSNEELTELFFKKIQDKLL